MNAMPTTAQMTATEFLALPWPEHGRQELLDGELVVDLTAARPSHQFAILKLATMLNVWCSAAPDRGFVIPEIITGLDDRNVLVPDLQWYAAGRRLGDDPPQPLGDIVVEARSASTWHRDLGIKRRLYEQHGAREYWLLDVVASTVLRLTRSTPTSVSFDRTAELAGDDPLGSPLLPGFALPIRELYARPDRPSGE